MLLGLIGGSALVYGLLVSYRDYQSGDSTGEIDGALLSALGFAICALGAYTGF